MDAFRVAEERKMTWKILPDKQKIGNWETQKATTEFAGRKWTAWFCSDIPIQDGRINSLACLVLW
jgi:GLPGLI family protein